VTQTGTLGPAVRAVHASADLRRAWEEFLGRYDWQWLLTFTWDPAKRPRRETRIPEQAAVRMVRAELSVLQRRLVGRHWSRSWPPAAEYAIALEVGSSGDYHAHVLLRSPHLLRRDLLRAMEGRWRQRRGILDVRAVTDVKGATHYVTKQTTVLSRIALSPGMQRIGGQRPSVRTK
jgi:hypothetical protein